VSAPSKPVAASRQLGAYSEVGKLRRVLVSAPGLAHERLTPSNCDALLFDDVFWVQQARTDHFDFVSKMQDRGVEVLEMGQLLGETLAMPTAREWVLDRKVTPDFVGVGMLDELKAWMRELPPDALARFLIGGVTLSDLPFKPEGMFGPYLGAEGFVLPPLPNMLFTRDTSAWIYGGVTLNPMHWPARRQETLLAAAVYRFHPTFADAGFSVWWGDPDVDHGPATLEGGDIMPIGKGVVLVGMGERSTPQAVGQLAQALFKAGAVTRVVACQMPQSRAAMHLDTVFSFCNRDTVTSFVEVANQIVCYSLYPTASFPPAATATSRRANSGTTATTSSRWSPAWWSATTATPTPTRSCARPASKSSPSAAASSGAVAVAGIA
jgi:arginine deiminase